MLTQGGEVVNSRVREILVCSPGVKGQREICGMRQ